ncbi:MAG: DUF3098 domain-containing protein [Bacteroidales bacterium]|jgi:hypothetical protein|nr:DUF3098 domain-containing protein [Bacteroidales bacterium]
MADNSKMAITRKGLKWILMGFLVMVAGFILMMGGGVKDPQVFNWAMFDFRRLVAAPVVILCGVAIVIIAIIKRPALEEENKK